MIQYLPLLIAIPLVGALGVAALPASAARRSALVATVAAALLGGLMMFEFFGRVDAELWGRYHFETSAPLIAELGLEARLGVDSVSVLLIALTLLLGPICVAASATAITRREKTYYAWLLVLQAAMTGVFAARDLVLFYVFFEFTLVPMYILISLFGSTNRARAATKFFLYTFTGSVIALAGLVYVAWVAHGVYGAWVLDLDRLAAAARRMSGVEQGWVLAALLAGFAVKVPLVPLHTWLPLAHTEAPTAGSVILAGVLLKLGTYGLYRFALGFTPEAFAAYAGPIGVVCILGILYGGLVCWVQSDVKRLVAYSSVAHLGFCVLGLAALNATGVTGSVVYMINHGLSTGALFLLIGMIYERYHTRSMRELGGLARRMPVWSTFMVFFVMSSVGLPGLNGFVGEFLCLLGAFQSDPRWPGSEPGASGVSLGWGYAAVAGAGMIVAAIYLLHLTGRVVFGPLVEPHTHDDHGHAPARGDAAPRALPPDLSAREIAVLTPLAVLCLVLGVWATPLLKAIEPSAREVLAHIPAAPPAAGPAPSSTPPPSHGQEAHP